MYKPLNEMYSTFTEVFWFIFDSHAPIKTKNATGNQRPFMVKKLSTAIMNKLKTNIANFCLERIYQVNKVNGVYQVNEVNKSDEKDYFKKVIRKGYSNNSSFWNTAKPILESKGFLLNENIAIENNDIIVRDDKGFTPIFNHHFVNIEEKSSGMTSDILRNKNENEDLMTIESIVAKYQNHPTIMSNKSNYSKSEKFEIPKVKIE